ncbi:polysaccharide deacetylase family protein [Halorubrum ezzemoulense]|uniref:polysaccharide deacetylase family protein n=1 Tax=Halorubrum ezzemoulense TaxID=337243 RepID=UPI00232F1FB3|nr:polysaccharide deacetylase family protein [Halorubrum ezzemoulense]MDB2274164.1 polysaccharide deacetylase family protein [Halorubrum ezzemoulense]
MSRDPKWIAFSVDLEPNKDDSLTGIREAMEWYDETVPRGTIYTTYRIATELPDVVAMLADNHEIGVHVHPREFEHEHDQFARLSAERQKELIQTTREKLVDVTSLGIEDIVSFRAGRHSANKETFDVLSDLGFQVDASINVRYTNYLPDSLTKMNEPFHLDNGLLEIPTTYYRPSLLSCVGLRVFPQRNVTATASTLRTDTWFCSGTDAMSSLISSVDRISMYMHPYDATNHHINLKNNGTEFRERFNQLRSQIDLRFETADDVSNIS